MGKESRHKFNNIVDLKLESKYLTQTFIILWLILITPYLLMGQPRNILHKVLFTFNSLKFKKI